MTIQELINNPAAEVEKERITEHFSGKTVLITGGAGYIGSRLCHALFDFGAKKVIAVDIDDTRLHELWLEMDKGETFVSCLGNITDLARLAEIFAEHKVNIVFHTAAIKHVPLAELHVKETIKTNVIGTENLLKIALAAHKVDQFINISTDKAADAINVMGKSKKVAETLCQSYGDEYDVNTMTVRFGNIYGSRGSVVPTFENKLKNNKPVQITDVNMERYFIKPEDAILLTLQACTFNKTPDEVFTFDMGDPIKIVDIIDHIVQSLEIPAIKCTLEIIGMRPGEKLTETLLSHDESRIETEHPKIYKILRNVSMEDPLCP